MRILHTSDWHLGKTIENNYRHDEQEAFLEFLCSLCEGEGINLVVVAGDIYDTSNPPSRSEEIFYRYVKKLSADGKRPVIIISGNHDSPVGLSAAIPLAIESGIFIAGSHKYEYPYRKLGRCDVIESREGFISLRIPSLIGEGSETVGIAFMPFPSEQRLKESFIESHENEREAAASYSERVISSLLAVSDSFRPDSVNIMVGHFYTSGGITSDSERQISLGGAYTVSKEDLPKNADYIALGHLHRAQRVSENCFYSGSPLQYSRSEIGYAKSVSIVDVNAGEREERVAIDRVEIPQLRPVEVWKAADFEHALSICEENKDRSVWAYMEIDTDRSLEKGEIKALHEIKPDLLSIIPTNFVKRASECDFEESDELPIEDVFRNYYEASFGRSPDDEVMRILAELIGGEFDDDAPLMEVIS